MNHLIVSGSGVAVSPNNMQTIVDLKSFSIVAYQVSRNLIFASQLVMITIFLHSICQSDCSILSKVTRILFLAQQSSRYRNYFQVFIFPDFQCFCLTQICQQFSKKVT